MCVHALHTVHALPDLRIAGGRLGDGFFLNVAGAYLIKLTDSNESKL